MQISRSDRIESIVVRIERECDDYQREKILSAIRQIKGVLCAYGRDNVFSLAKSEKGIIQPPNVDRYGEEMNEEESV